MYALIYDEHDLVKPKKKVISVHKSRDTAETALEKRKKKVVVAFDEFQEVASYPQKAEAILRTHIQKLNNIQFIFSGRKNHLLKEMFYSNLISLTRSTG